MVSRARLPDVGFVLLGILALVLKGRVDHPIIQSYGGNVAASFSAFYILKLSELPQKYQIAFAAAMALLATELFEVTDGFGFMSNTYDPMDYIANVIGVALAAIVNITMLVAVRPHGGSNDSAHTSK